MNGSNGGTNGEASSTPTKDSKRPREDPNMSERPQDDWQVAYVWAFIIKFKQLSHIPKLESIDDFERCLTEPVANRPDDILEGVLIRFLHNLKPGLRNLDCTNIQHHLSNYINDQLVTTEFTAWDPSAINEQPHASCCDAPPGRELIGRIRAPDEPASYRTRLNPIKQAEEKGGGLFELDWRERAKLLRQMVDWQLTHAESIRNVINAEAKVGKKGEEVESTRVEPLGLDRGKNRIWAFDASGRLYTSGNPFKRPCPLRLLAGNRAEFDAQLGQYTAHGETVPGTAPSSSAKGKAAKAEMLAWRKTVKGIEDERQLAVKLGEMVPALDKEEQRLAKARRKVAQAMQLAHMAEERATRTRRQPRRNYADDIADLGDDDDWDPRGRRGGGSAAAAASESARLYIPGERQSRRLAAQAADDTRSVSSRGEDPPPPPVADADGAVVTGKKAAKGYAWVEEVVPVDQTQIGEPTNGHDHAEKANGVDGPAIEVDDDESAPASPEATNGAAEGSATPNGPNDPIIVD